MMILAKRCFTGQLILSMSTRAEAKAIEKRHVKKLQLLEDSINERCGDLNKKK